MSFYNTGNPVPSIDPRDLDDNAKHLDVAIHSAEDTWVDRLGATRKSIKGVENGLAVMQEGFDEFISDSQDEFNAFLAGTQYEVPVAYTAGLSITRATQTVIVSGIVYRPIPGSLPFVTTTFAADAAKWAVLGDASLRQDMANTATGARLSAYQRGDLGSNGSANVQRMLDSQSVNPWEFESLIVSKPTPSDPSTWDWAPALQAMFVAASASGMMVSLTPGMTYTVQSGLTLTDLFVNANFNGARIVRGVSCPNVAAITVDNTMGAIKSVTSLTSTTYDYSGDGSLSDVSAATVADASDLAVGDFIKIVADDLIPSSVTANNERIGEIFEIGAKSGNTIYSIVPLREAYVTNIRISKMPVKKCVLAGLDLSDAIGYPVGRGAALLQINSSIRPKLIFPEIHDGASFGVIFKNCYQPTTYGAQVRRMRTSSVNGAFGYGIYEISCVEGLHVAPRGKLMRHVYTTGALAVPTPGSGALYNYGGVLHSEVHDGVASETENAAWDTHEDSFRVRFVNCSAVGKQTGAGNSRFGFQLRGRGDESIGGYTEGVASAKVVQAYVSGYTTRIIGHKHRMSRGITQASGLFGITGTASVRASVEIQADVEGGTSEIVSALYADISGSIKAKCRYAAVASYAALRLDSASTFEGDLDLDFSLGSGLNTRAVKTVDEASAAKIRNLRVKRAAVGTWFVGDLSSVNARITVDRLDCDTLPVSSAGGFAGPGASSVRFVTYVAVDQFSRSAGIGALINGTNTLNAFSFELQLLDVPMTANRVVNLPTSGIPIGRSFTVSRSANSTGAFTLDVGGVSSLTAASTSTDVVWSGTAYVKIR